MLLCKILIMNCAKPFGLRQIFPWKLSNNTTSTRSKEKFNTINRVESEIHLKHVSNPLQCSTVTNGVAAVKTCRGAMAVLFSCVGIQKQVYILRTVYFLFLCFVVVQDTLTTVTKNSGLQTSRQKKGNQGGNAKKAKRRLQVLRKDL